MQPSRGDLHVNAPLTDILMAFMQKESAFIAAQAFPIVPVTKESDRYITIPKGAWFRDEAKIRADGASSAGSGFTVDNTPNYACQTFAFHMDVTERMRANADKPLNMDEAATRYVGRKLMIRREREFASKFWTLGLWTGSTTGTDITPTTLWDTSSGDPLKDIELQADFMEVKTGYRPNVCIVTSDVNTQIKHNPNVKDLYKHTRQGPLTEEIIGSALGMKYLVARASYNSQEEMTTEAATMARIFTGKQALLAYAAPQPAIMEPSAGYIFAWNGLYGSNAYAGRIKKFWMDELNADRIEGEQSFDQKMVAADLGVFFTGVIS